MRILVATDGSDPAAIGIELARDVATLSRGELRIVAVAPPTSELFGGAWPAEMIVDPEPLERAVCDQLEARLRAEVAETPADLRPSSILRRGRPATEIVSEAVDWRADLIVMGSRGHGGLSSILLGSVSEEVIDRSSVPVLVARRPRIRRLIVAVDGSLAADEAVDFVARDRTFAGVDAAVVNVAPPIWPWWLGVSAGDTDSVEVIMGMNETARRESQAAADRAAKRLNDAGLAATRRDRTGDPAEELVHVSMELDADTIVIGSRGRIGLRRLVLGSVARQVMRHAPASVLVVHPRAAVDVAPSATPTAARPFDEPTVAPSATPTAARPVDDPTGVRPQSKETPMKILLAYDGGEPAMRALKTAAGIATAMGGTVDVVSVVPLHAGRAPVDPWDNQKVHDEELREASARLAEMGIFSRLLEPVGDPARTIETIARNGAYDMVVLGSRRQGVVGRILQGSVSEHVATHADATVVIAR
jgi:nucleotide-binding universal stress UspA family protein